ncbi:8817_t:CDS:2, partial [Gigaspora margarita]
DITDGIPKQATLQFCRNCERYLQPPNIWIRAELESRELLSLCLKKLKGLNKVKLIDAGFIWTEPHSRRIKVKLTVQKEVFISTLIQQITEVEFVVNYQQCGDCTRLMAKNTWQAMVQVRQKVNHKRTFLFLEQLILKHHAHKDTINIKEVKDGLDFFYAHKSHAVKMVEFLNAVVPINPLVLCYRVGNSIHIMDPNTLAVSEISTSVYWRQPFNSLATTKNLVEYYVLDVEPLGPTRGKYILADILVARSSDFGKNDITFYARSHLGGILSPGDNVMGYDLSSSNFNDFAYDSLNQNYLPDVVLVKKSYPQKRRKNRRNWKLKSLAKEEEKLDLEKMDQDYELFLRDLEEDSELRQNVNLYKANNNNAMDIDTTVEENNDEDDFPEVKLEELLDELTLDDDVIP